MSTACSASVKINSISGTWTPSFYGYDGHGNVRFLTNSAGNDYRHVHVRRLWYAASGAPAITPVQFLYSGERLEMKERMVCLRFDGLRYCNQAIGSILGDGPGVEHSLPGPGRIFRQAMPRLCPCGSLLLLVLHPTPTNQSQALAACSSNERCCLPWPRLRTGARVAGHSYSAYADDNPVNRTDPTGREAAVEYELIQVFRQ